MTGRLFWAATTRTSDYMYIRCASYSAGKLLFRVRRRTFEKSEASKPPV